MMDGARKVKMIFLVKLTKIVFMNAMTNATESRSVLHSLTKPQHLPIITTATLVKDGHTHRELVGPTQNVT